jgi:hypothetical protein
MLWTSDGWRMPGMGNSTSEGNKITILTRIRGSNSNVQFFSTPS